MISRTGRHALRALIYLAALPPGDYLGAASLAERIGAPANYLGKLLNALANAGIVESRKGPGGGFRLAGPADALSLFAVLDPVEDFAKWESCFLGGGPCPADSPCGLHAEWGRLRDGYLSFLRSTTLARLVRYGPVAPQTRSGP